VQKALNYSISKEKKINVSFREINYGGKKIIITKKIARIHRFIPAKI
jgi:hypothetical protein